MQTYEERITLWQARSFEDAIKLGEAEAEEYGEAAGLEYLHLAQVFDQKAKRVGNGSEVFSLMRDSPLAPNDYINRFFDTGDERDMPTG
jgi:hypothetical protein